MTIDIQEPELEALIQQRMSSGRYRNVEDVLLQALISPEKASGPSVPLRSLDEVFAMVRGLADDLDLSRDPTPDRLVDLS